MLSKNILSQVAIWQGRERKFSPSFLLPTLTLIIAFLMGVSFSLFGSNIMAVAIGILILVALISLRQDELIVSLVIVVHLYVDWYLGLLFSAQIITLALLIIFFLLRSPQHPWRKPGALWLWLLFLVISIFPAIRGALRLYDIAYYYPNIICGALLMFWLGTVVARDAMSVERFFKILAGVSTLLAIHTVVQALTGTVLFGSTRFDQFIATTADYALTTGSSVHRVGSFFVDPNWNGTFFATMLFIPLGLFFSSSLLLEKIFYLAEAVIMLPALFYTYSNGAWIGLLGGFIALMVFVGRVRYRLLLPLLFVISAIAVMIFFPAQINLQLQHLSDPSELSLRVGAWQTGIRVISAFPLTGVGLGLDAYLLRSQPYRVPAQYLPLSHPHNSYIEIGAMAGLPVLIMFLALVLFALWLALRNWFLADPRNRSLLGGGLAVITVLSINSWSINAWTFPPLAAIGWIVLGMISSPLLLKGQQDELMQDVTKSIC